MDSITPLQSECAVSGILYVVLMISRLAGTSPLKFERLNGSWRARVSTLAVAYCCIVQALLLTGTAISSLDRSEVVDGYESTNNTGFMRIALVLHLLVHSGVGVAIVCTGPDRMRHMIDCTARLQQINAEIDRLFEPSKSNSIIMSFVLIICMLFGYFATFFDYGVYLSDITSAQMSVTYVSCAFSAVFLCLLQVQLFAIQFWVVAMHLVSTQKRLNKCLSSVLNELEINASSGSQPYKYMRLKPRVNLNALNPIPNHMITCVIDLLPVIVRGGSRADPETLDKLIDMYCSMCGMVRQLNDSNGLVMLTMLSFLGTYMMTAPYFVVAILYRMHTAVPAVRSLTVLSWCLLCFLALALTAEPCHRSHVQLWLTKRLIRRMRRFATKDEPEVTIKLKLFQRHIDLNPVRFAPLKLLTFNRSLLVAVLSTIVTYLSVIIHL